MISVSTTFNNKQSAAVREVECKVEVYSGSTLQATYTKADRIISVEIQRTGDNSKLFGYTVTQRVNIHLQDLSRQVSIASNQKLKVYLGFGTEYINFPTFVITEVNRDERTNELSITGYDQLYFLNKYNYGNLGLTGTKTITDIGNAIAHILNSSVSTAKKRYISDTSFNLSYTTAPFEYDVDLKTVLTQICEATQTIAYMDYTDNLTFVKLKNGNESTGTIAKASYFNLKTKENKKLTTIFYEGAQTKSATTGATGTTQYIRDNKLLDSRSDLQTILNNAISTVGGTIIPQFEMEWRGKVQLEYGDKIGITTKNNTVVNCYLIDDTIKFNGALVEVTKFSFDKQESESEGETFTIAEAITANKVGLEKAIEVATAEINGANGGYVTIIDADKDGNPDNIFITDLQITSDDIVLYNGAYVLSNDTNCTKVLRVNQNGLGISSGTKAGTASNGYQTAVTGSGINASTITTGYLNANYIKAGTITADSGGAYWNLNTGAFKSGDNSYFYLPSNGASEWYLNNNRIGYISAIATGTPVTQDNTSFNFIYDRDNSKGIGFNYEKNGTITEIARINRGSNSTGGQIVVQGTEMGGLIYRRNLQGVGERESKLGVGKASGAQTELSFSAYTYYSSKNMPTSSYNKPSGVSNNEYYGVALPNVSYYRLTKDIPIGSYTGIRVKCTMASYGWATLYAVFYDSSGGFISAVALSDICKTTVMTVDGSADYPSNATKVVIAVMPDSGYSGYWAGWKDVHIYALSSIPTCSIELNNPSNSNEVLARLDVALNYFEGGIARVRVQSNQGVSSWWELTNNREIIASNGCKLRFANDGLYYNDLKLAFA